MKNPSTTIPGSCAVITGASGGLGTSFALECAARGYHLLLVDLPGLHLQKLGAFLAQNFDVQVEVLETDLLAPGAEQLVLDTLEQKQLSLRLLINNAGIPQNDLFEDTDGAYMRKMIGVNCTAMVALTRALLPALKRNAPSQLICVSSLGGFYVLPRKTCYSATKGFVRQFCQALRMELAPAGVQVGILCPGPMTTNTANYQLHRQLNWFSQKMVQFPGRVARYTLDQALRGREIIIPGRLNRVLKGVSDLIPAFIQRKLSAYSMKQLAAR